MAGVVSMSVAANKNFFIPKVTYKKSVLKHLP
jgi:hypothetical protein